MWLSGESKLASVGVRVLDAYGMSENSAPGLVNRPYLFKYGTAGLTIPGAET